MLNVATMAAGFAGGPWAAFAMSTLATGIQVTDGSMDWKQGAFQVGISGATALIGVGAGELGAMLGGASSAATQAAAETATKSLTQVITENVVRTAGSTLLSGVNLEGGKLGYDKDKMKNWKTWAGAGITAAAGSITGSMNLSGLSSSLVTGVGSSLNSGLTTGNWADSFKQGAITSIGNYIGNSIAGGMTGEGGLNTGNEYTKQLISNYTTFAARKLLGSDEKFDMNTIGNVDTISMLINQTYSGIKSSRQAEYEKANRDRLIESGLIPEEVERTLRDAGTAETGAKAADRFKDPLAGLDMALSGVFVSLGRGLGQTMNQIGESIKSGAEAVWSGVKGTTNTILGAIGDFGQSLKNKAVWGVFGTDSNAAVENAKLDYQFKSYGIGTANVDMDFRAGGIVRNSEGQVYQVRLDDNGNRTLVDTGINENFRLAGFGAHNEQLSLLIKEGVDINSRYQAMHNYEDGKTSVNGIEISFSDNSYNTKNKIANVSGRLWTNLTAAANESEVTGIHVYAVDYGSSNPHAAGVGIDITGLYAKGDENMISYRRDYQDGNFNPVTPNTTITNFENAFWGQEGSEIMWTPWQMKTTKEWGGWSFENMVTQYPGVAETGKPGREASELLKEYGSDNGVKKSSDITKLWRSYQHTNHGHFQVGYQYKNNKNRFYPSGPTI